MICFYYNTDSASCVRNYRFVIPKIIGSTRMPVCWLIFSSIRYVFRLSCRMIKRRILFPPEITAIIYEIQRIPMPPCRQKEAESVYHPKKQFIQLKISGYA